MTAVCIRWRIYYLLFRTSVIIFFVWFYSATKIALRPIWLDPILLMLLWLCANMIIGNSVLHWLTACPSLTHSLGSINVSVYKRLTEVCMDVWNSQHVLQNGKWRRLKPWHAALRSWQSIYEPSWLYRRALHFAASVTDFCCTSRLGVRNSTCVACRANGR